MNFVVLIKSCRKNAGRRDACRQTWVADLHARDIPYTFIVGDGSEPVEHELDTTVIPGTGDGYRQIAPKLAIGLQCALEQNPDRIFVGDDDTYVCVERLLDAQVEKEKTGFVDYEGFFRPGSEFNEGFPYMQGSAVWYSRKAAELVANSSLMVEGVMDDVRHGKIFNGMAITFNHDPRYWPGPVAERIQLSNDLITTHKCTPQEMRTIHTLWLNNGRR